MIPPNRDLSIFHGRLQLTEQDKAAGTRMPIDFFLRSLAEDQGDRAVAVILSGTGSDGTLGVRAVQGAGGTVFVQDPAAPDMTGCREARYRRALPIMYCPWERSPRRSWPFSDGTGRGRAAAGRENDRRHAEDTDGGEVEDRARLLALQEEHRHPPHPGAG